MPQTCVIKACSYNCKKNKPTGVSIHRFPPDPELKKLWVEFVKTQNKKQYDHRPHHRLCSQHFARDAFLDGALKFKSVPSEFHTRFDTSDDGWCDKPELFKQYSKAQTSTSIIISPELEFLDTNTENEEDVDDPRMIVDDPLKIIVDPPANSNDPPENINDHAEVINLRTDAEMDCFPVSPSSGTAALLNCVTPERSTRSSNIYSPEEVASRLRETGRKRHVNDFTESDFDTPRKRARNLKRLKKLVEDDHQKLENARKKASRWKKKAASLQDVMKELKEKDLISEKAQEVLQEFFPGDAGEVLRRAIESEAQNKNAKYNPAVRRFAMTLNFLSPAAYRYVREKLWKCLPHEKTIYKWLSSIDGKPGFLEEAAKAVKGKVEEAKSKNQTLVANLVVDDVAIRKGLVKVGDEILGYPSHGTNEDSDDAPLASQAFFLMLVCVNGSWKIPIGYALIDGLSAIERANLVRECLIFCHTTGIKVKGLTFDGTISNFAMGEALGSKLKYTDLQTWFPHPVTAEKVYIILDAAHMIKLWRNVIGGNDLIDGDGDVASFDDLRNLHKVQEEEGIMMAPKLRNRHLDFVKEKMVVKLAAQLISDDVADSLLLLRVSSILRRPQFASSKGTEKYCRIGNILWDIFNSKNFLAKGDYKSPLRALNYDKVIEFLDGTAKPYILQLRKKSNQQLLLDSKLKTAFLGFLINIESLKGLYADLVLTGILKFILMYKFSQDHLEIFFGHLRSMFGCNNNPLVSQLIAALRRLLTQVELGGRRGSNAWPVDCTTVLHVSSSRRSKNADGEDPGAEKNTDDDDDDAVVANHDFTEDIRLSPFVTDVVQYIAGFVSARLNKSLHCPECIQSLFAETTTSELIKIKNRGGLKFPSEDVVAVCAKTETVLRAARVSKAMFTKNLLQHQLTVISTLPPDVFQCLDDHILDQNPIDNHRTVLIKKIVKKYLVCRVCSEVLNFNNSIHKSRIRKKLTKLTLFNNQ